MFVLCYRVILHNDDTRLPVYEKGRKEYSVEELVSLLFVKRTDHRVCLTQPTRVKQNYSFLVDLNCVSSVADLRADDCGV